MRRATLPTAKVYVQARRRQSACQTPPLGISFSRRDFGSSRRISGACGGRPWRAALKRGHCASWPRASDAGSFGSARWGRSWGVDAVLDRAESDTDRETRVGPFGSAGGAGAWLAACPSKAPLAPLGSTRLRRPHWWPSAWTEHRGLKTCSPRRLGNAGGKPFAESDFGRTLGPGCAC